MQLSDSMKRTLILACALSFSLKVILALATYGTNDVLTWEAHVRALQARGVQALYLEGSRPIWEENSFGVNQQFNHPPFMIHALRAWAAISDATGVPLRAWLRLTSAAADIAMIWLVLGILRAESIAVNSRMLLAVSLSPVSILVSGFHGNTDPIMICLLLVSIYLIATRRPIWLAGAAFGMAMNIKIVPIIFVPAILLSLSPLRKRAAFVLAAGAVFAGGSMPYLAHDPSLIARCVFGYNPGAGLWGFPMFALLISEDALARYVVVGKYLGPAAVLLSSIWISVRAPRYPLFLRCGLVAFLFLFLASGFGMQYLVWLVPWMAALSCRNARWHYALVSCDVVLFYGAFSRWRWHIANVFDYSPPSIALIGILQTACWLSVGVVVIAYARSILKQAKLKQRALPYESQMAEMAR